MKILNTLRELWEYCEYCPICHDSCREITVQVGPDDRFVCVDATYYEEELVLQCEYRNKMCSYNVNYTIDMINNKFAIEVGNQHELDCDDVFRKKAIASYFYFYINSDCRKCNRAYANSTDIELDQKSQLVQSIGIDREGIYLVEDGGYGFHITLQYDTNSMKVSRVALEDEVILDDGRVFDYPMVNLDLSNSQKTMQKIKTLILFS